MGSRIFLSVLGILLLRGATPLEAQDDCAKAVFRQQGGMVSMTWKVAWKPTGCRLVLQAYQNSQLVGELGKNEGVANATIPISQLTQKPGRTELKIWVPGSSSPSDSIWVVVSTK